MPILLHKPFVGKQRHIFNIALHDILEGRTIIDIGCIHVPIHNQTEVVEDKTQLATHVQRWFDSPFLPICWALRPSRRG